MPFVVKNLKDPGGYLTGREWWKMCLVRSLENARVFGRSGDATTSAKRYQKICTTRRAPMDMELVVVPVELVEIPTT